jgi:hypothetical protein
MGVMTLLNEKVKHPACNAVRLKVQAKTNKREQLFYIHPGMLTVCKNNLLPGGTGELVRNYPYSLTYTRLGPQSYILTLEHASEGTVHSESVKAHKTRVLETNKHFVVQGFSELVDACFLREFYIPRVAFPVTPMSMFTEKRAVQKTLECMSLTMRTDVSAQAPAMPKVMCTGTLETPATEKSIAPPPTTRSLLKMDTARRMLYFNRNAVSRIRSIFHAKPLTFARNLCLSVALAHAGRHTQDGMLVMHTMQYVPLTENSKKALEALKQGPEGTLKPASTICYLTQGKSAGEPTREKVRLYKLLPSTLETLRENSIILQTPTAYVAFTREKGQPLFIANTNNSELEQFCHAPQADWHAASTNSEKRLWLHAAATEHAFVARSMPSLLPCLADDRTTYVAANPAFELWQNL